MTTYEKYCFYSSSCSKEDCKFKHFINDLELRKEMKDDVNEMFGNKIPSNEPDPEGKRISPCIYGYLCGKEDCGFKHRMIFSARHAVSSNWYIKHPKAKKEISAEGMKKLEELAKEEGMTVNQLIYSYKQQKEETK